jgi:hypothetical protein
METVTSPDFRRGNRFKDISPANRPKSRANLNVSRGDLRSDLILMNP